MSRPPKLPSQEELSRFVRDPAAFRGGMYVDADSGTSLFHPDPWQAEDFARIDKVWMRATGHLKDDGPRRAWVGRSRGHSKTTDEALMICWAMPFAKRSLMGLAAAASRDQAQILRDRISMLVMLNPWLSEILDIQNYKILNKATGGQLDIISSDAPSSYGALVDFILCDELTHWRNRELWDSLFSSAAKREHCALIIMTNAGFKNDWQWDVFQMAQQHPNWEFINHDGPKASWISESTLAEQRLLLPDKPFRRLWLNEWQDEAGDELSLDDIRACVKPGLEPMRGDEEDWIFIGGLDLATKRHRSAFVVIAANPKTQRLRLAYCRNWKAGGSGMIDLGAIRKEIIDQQSRFGLLKVLYDPSQAVLMAQDCAKAGVRMEEMNFSSAKNLSLMATTILEVFRSRQIDLYNDVQLIGDLAKLNIVEKSALNFKIEADADSTGHADTALAFAIALPEAVNLAGVVPIRPFVDRSIAQTVDEMRRRMEELEQQDATKGSVAVQPSVTANYSGKTCPWCRRIIKAATCDCGQAYAERSPMAMILEEAGILITDEEAA